jgi:phage gp16-like protein
MDEAEIKKMLDDLADYQAHRDLLDADKRSLLDEVKIPEEVQAIVKAGMDKLTEINQSFTPEMRAARETAEAELAAIVIPEEIRIALEEIDHKRGEVNRRRNAAEDRIATKVRTLQDAVKAETEAKTADVYKAIAQRKAEIEAEFAGKAEAVDKNIAKLTKDIKAAVTDFRLTVKGSFMMATYGEGRKTWNPKRLDKYTESHPDITECFTVGDPVITIRRI